LAAFGACRALNSAHRFLWAAAISFLAARLRRCERITVEFLKLALFLRRLGLQPRAGLEFGQAAPRGLKFCFDVL
jgi:hypothetical protein